MSTTTGWESTPNKLVRILGETTPLWKRIVAYASAPQLFDQLAYDGTRKRIIAYIICKYYNIPDWDFWSRNLNCLVHDYTLKQYADPEFVKEFLRGWIEIRDRIDDMIEKETGHAPGCQKHLAECQYNDE